MEQRNRSKAAFVAGLASGLAMLLIASIILPSAPSFLKYIPSASHHQPDGQFKFRSNLSIRILRSCDRR